MAVATSQLGTTLCYASAIHLLFIRLFSVQSYFNNGLGVFFLESASQPREQTSLFRRARHLFNQTSVKSHTELAVDRYKRKKKERY